MPGSVPHIPGFKLDDPEMVNSFRREVAQLLGRRNPDFPGAQPVSFARHHLDELARRDYLLCEKTDGIRCLLYCTTGNSDEEEVHYLIDRKNDYYYVQGLHLPHHEDPEFGKFHSNSLLDGELVMDTLPDGTEKLRFLIFDLLVLDGEKLIDKLFDKRFGRLIEYIVKPIENMTRKFRERVEQEFPFEVKVKQMDKPYALEEMFRVKLPNLPHGNDGLVFTCKNTPYIMGTDDHILKWKPAHENSIDFRLNLGNFPTYIDEMGERCEDFDAIPSVTLEVYWGNNDYRDYEPLHMTQEDWEATKRRALKEQLPIDGRIIECYRDEQGQWRFKKEEDGGPRYRDDKKTANHVSTVTKVLQSIADAVSEEDLIAAQANIHKGWKARHPEEIAEAKRRAAAAAQQHSR